MENDKYERIHYLKSGISLEWLPEKFRTFSEDFICGICGLLVINPKICEECSMLFCEPCVNKQNNEKCYNCQRNNVKQCSQFNLNILNKFQIKCPFSNCDKIISYPKFRTHLENCEFAQLKCLNCGIAGLKQEIEKHCRNCSNNKITCEFCEQKVDKKTYKEHISNCTASQKTNDKELLDEIEGLKNKIVSLENENLLLKDKIKDIREKYENSQSEFETLQIQKNVMQKEISKEKIFI